jgi:ketohexokinase
VILQAEGTRTIVSHGGGLDEMSSAEFVARFREIDPVGEAWCHFEGRVPGVTGECVDALRKMEGEGKGGKVWVSVECEKPDRTGLDGVVGSADVVFYSRLWAEVSCDSLFLLKRRGD